MHLIDLYIYGPQLTQGESVLSFVHVFLQRMALCYAIVGLLLSCPTLLAQDLNFGADVPCKPIKSSQQSSLANALWTSPSLL